MLKRNRSTETFAATNDPDPHHMGHLSIKEVETPEEIEVPKD